MRTTSNLAKAWFSIALLALIGCEPSIENIDELHQQPLVLRVGFPPGENPAEIIRKNKPLVEYLQRQTGASKIEILVPPSYTATIEDLQKHKLDLVYFGALTYVVAKNIINITPLVQGVVDGSSENYSLIIARKDSGIHSLADLPGHRFAFGDVASTSGHLIPHQALLAAGIQPHKDFDVLLYTGAHDKTARAVQQGTVEAGALSARLYPSMLQRGQLSQSSIRVIWKSEPFADFPWAIRDDLDSQLINKIRNAFVNLHDPKTLQSLGVDGFRVSNDSEFDAIRRAAIKLGFMQKNDSL